MKLLVVDLCNTLYKSNTTFDFLDYYFKDKKKYKILKKIRNSILYKVVNLLLFKISSVDINKILFTRLLRGEKRSDIKKGVDEFYKKILDDKRIEETHELVKQYKKQGYTILIISASYDFIVEKIAEEIKVNSSISTLLEYNGGYLTGKIIEELLVEKHNKLKQINIDYSELVVISDNETDYNLVKMSNKAYIPLNRSNKKFWYKKKLFNVEFIEV